MNTVALAAVISLVICGLVVVAGALLFWFLLRRGVLGFSRPADPVDVPDTTKLVDQAEVGELARREAELERLAGELADQRNQLRDREARIEAERDRHAEQDEQSRRAQTAAEVATQRSADRQAGLDRREAELVQRERRLADDQRARETAADERDARLVQREESLVARMASLDSRAAALEAARASVEDQRTQLEQERAALADERHQVDREREGITAELERVAGLDAEQARAELMQQVEHASRIEAAQRAREIERTATREAETRARKVLVTTIQRLASEQTSESVVSTLDLPSDDVKGRIIGREGRNIRHFEQVTGVNVMIDDTPGSVLVSSFDPVRRETARMTLAELVADGRIHPARIEEVHEKSVAAIAERCHRNAEDALAEVGISDLDPALVPILGSLTYRTSYGQNVLRHLVECAHIAGMMAAELGLDVQTCRRAAFLHDIGKALTHQVEGSHAIVGADLARRHGEHPDIVHAIEAHHNEVEPTTVEAILTQAADAISGSRPGARRESLEAYVHRLERLEQIALDHEGVDRVFAMQAGREVRVMVSPDEVDDLGSHALAREIAHEIESELTYPGQIRVTVVRESRATQLAH